MVGERGRDGGWDPGRGQVRACALVGGAGSGARVERGRRWIRAKVGGGRGGRLLSGSARLFVLDAGRRGAHEPAAQALSAALQLRALRRGGASARGRRGRRQAGRAAHEGEGVRTATAGWGPVREWDAPGQCSCACRVSSSRELLAQGWQSEDGRERRRPLAQARALARGEAARSRSTLRLRDLDLPFWARRGRAAKAHLEGARPLPFLRFPAGKLVLLCSCSVALAPSHLLAHGWSTCCEDTRRSNERAWIERAALHRRRFAEMKSSRHDPPLRRPTPGVGRTSDASLRGAHCARTSLFRRRRPARPSRDQLLAALARRPPCRSFPAVPRRTL